MNSQIHQELQLLLVSAYAGMVLGVSYDVVRILRRIKPASIVREFLEDMLFWTVASIYLFHMFLQYNYGRPRYYGVGMAMIAMISYEWFAGRYLVRWISKTIRRILFIVLKPLKKIWNGFKLISRKAKKRLLKMIVNKGEENDI